jgi:peroxiredoxin
MIAQTLKAGLAGVTLSALAVTGLYATEAQVNEPAPDFTLTSIAGNEHSLSDFEGKTVVLEWTNPNCPFVVKHYDSGNMPELQESATEEGVVWLTINSTNPGHRDYEDAQSLQAWLDETGAAQTALLMDESGEVGQMYGAKTTPHMYIINPEGTLVYQGAIDSIPSADKSDIADATNYVKAALNSLQAGEMPESQQERPYGCSVKYGA